ncbi:pyridoxine 5-phosphate synthase [Thermotomaculum hydrothermale]|uniref:Pyridoxine 5'-phosphate synthase n=1 Tax=Thermotomaculum hydrothermale TaxID=981385 RepID=A0A7R6SYG7_9BACT|nr:pyridoxine 5'-phosphate synthase [Thermotomaculum hydrothermale]BBB32635.1 pyridoxine 5-phosphate synthase [Thermotomaculum hydrothermale]
MTKLGVNIDHIATVREARKIDIPDPVYAAVIAELAGADGITVHLRGDRRHIKERDVELLSKFIKTRLNIEMATTTEMFEIACKIKPYSVTLVPEKKEEVTTEGGLDVILHQSVLKTLIPEYKSHNIKISIFVDPDNEQIKRCIKLNADIIEINTGKYAETEDERERELELEKIKNAARFAAKSGLKVAAGHGLNYRNVKPIAQIPEIEELNIGHAIIARAIFVGLDKAVREMKELIKKEK